MPRCKLCKQDRELRDSRFLPAAVYATSTPTPPTLVRSNGNTRTPATTCALTNSLRQATSDNAVMDNRERRTLKSGARIAKATQDTLQ